jgi:hypothetical protein
MLDALALAPATVARIRDETQGLMIHSLGKDL